MEAGVLIPIIVLNAANHPEGLEWAVFSALVVSGRATILQARPVGPIGAGYPLYMGTSGAFIGVSTEAVAAGGLSLLATLVVVRARAPSDRLGAHRYSPPFLRAAPPRRIPVDVTWVR